MARRRSRHHAQISAPARLIRTYRPDAWIVVTVSPIPLKATFRPIPCVVANSVSKSILRGAVDAFLRREAGDERLRYFPSYEVALDGFEHPFMEDRRHIHKHVLDANMAAFERYYCQTGMTDTELLGRFRTARRLDREVSVNGHWAVPRANLLYHPPPGGAIDAPPAGPAPDQTSSRASDQS